MSRQQLQPYPGLRPFERYESKVFFGRQQQVDELLHRLKKQKFLAVLGASGSGKSSLVRAGLLPGLEKGYMGEVGSRWRIAELRPGDAPFERLAEGLKEIPSVSRAARSPLPNPPPQGEREPDDSVANNEETISDAAILPAPLVGEGLGKGGNLLPTQTQLPPEELDFFRRFIPIPRILMARMHRYRNGRWGKAIPNRRH